MAVIKTLIVFFHGVHVVFHVFSCFFHCFSKQFWHTNPTNPNPPSPPKTNKTLRKDALSDPAVQAEIMKVAKEKFPEVPRKQGCHLSLDGSVAPKKKVLGGSFKKFF